MIDPRFYEANLNKLNLIRIILCLIVSCLLFSVFVVLYLGVCKEIKEGYVFFHVIFVFFILYFMGVVITSLSTEIDTVRNDFYRAIQERNLTFNEYQQQKERK